MDNNFLWRVHEQVPGKGELVVLNRRQYKEVLIVPIHDLVPRQTSEQRYDHINAIESLLAGTGTKILKFYLHIDKDEQKKRLQARLDNPDKHWKFLRGALVHRPCQSQVVPRLRDRPDPCGATRWIGDEVPGAQRVSKGSGD